MTAVAPPPLAPRAWLRYDLVDRMVTALRPATVLEIGCGQGSMGARLAGRADYLAVEPDPVSFAVAQERISAAGGKVLNADHTAVPAGATYDLVCAFEVLEHLADDAGALADWVRFVAPGGHLMLSVPAFQGRFGPMDTRVGHYRRYEPAQLAGLLTAAGLSEPDVRVYGWPLGYALEAVRNRMDARHLTAESGAGPAADPQAADREAPGAAGAGPSPEERTAASGRHQQPARPVVGRAIEAATLPFRYLQRVQPARGTGLVAVATRPA
ncbi:MAG TPA: class I SAM-dependent methyltransferase [Mycobacteriales bacterium]|nr:class I SAM-dependent methyltransferase [Mycobacteriales bacterium]